MAKVVSPLFRLRATCPEGLYNRAMAIETTYSQAREKLASLMDRVTDHLEVVIITRRGGKRVALIDAAEYESLLETAHLMRSPRNAERLLLALDQARRGEGLEMSAEELRREVLGDTSDR
jgi:antitoxin YefM